MPQGEWKCLVRTTATGVSVENNERARAGWIVRKQRGSDFIRANLFSRRVFAELVTFDLPCRITHSAYTPAVSTLRSPLSPFAPAFPVELASKPTVFRLPRVSSFSLKKHGVRSIKAAVSRLVSPRPWQNRHRVSTPEGTQWAPYVCGGVERAELQRIRRSTPFSRLFSLRREFVFVFVSIWFSIFSRPSVGRILVLIKVSIFISDSV